MLIESWHIDNYIIPQLLIYWHIIICFPDEAGILRNIAISSLKSMHYSLYRWSLHLYFPLCLTLSQIESCSSPDLKIWLVMIVSLVKESKMNWSIYQNQGPLENHSWLYCKVKKTSKLFFTWTLDIPQYDLQGQAVSYLGEPLWENIFCSSHSLLTLL